MQNILMRNMESGERGGRGQVVKLQRTSTCLLVCNECLIHLLICITIIINILTVARVTHVKNQNGRFGLQSWLFGFFLAILMYY